MLLNAEELLALVNGDAEPDRLADLLDRLEHCPESADALQVLVSLRANREEALDAIHQAAEREATSPQIPLPSARPAAWPMSWAAQGLRMAATIAIVAVISVWAANTFYAPAESSLDTRTLATREFANIVLPNQPPNLELTSGTTTAAIIAKAYGALLDGDYETAKRALEGQPTDVEGHVLLYRGMSYYFLGEYEKALIDLVGVQALDSVGNTGTLHQAAWYEANALLALERPGGAWLALEKVKSADGYPFQDEATKVYGELTEALGMARPKYD